MPLLFNHSQCDDSRKVLCRHTALLSIDWWRCAHNCNADTINIVHNQWP